MLQARLEIRYDPMIDGIDRTLTLEGEHNYSLSVWRYAFELINQHTKDLTIPENDGKMFTVTLDGLNVHIQEV